jgi:hypothetical protein
LLNYYFLELFQLIGEINKKIIDVRLPNYLNHLIENKIRNIELDKNDKYKYFKANKDEIIHLQCICISVDDILFILETISKNKKEFENLNDYNNFSLILNKIYKESEKDIVSIMSHPKKNIFFMLFNEIYKSKINKVLKLYNKKRTSSILNIPNFE